MAYNPLKACQTIGEIYQCITKTRQTPIAIRIEDLVTNGRGFFNVQLGNTDRPEGPTPDFWLQTALRGMDLRYGIANLTTANDDIPDSNGSLLRAIKKFRARGVTQLAYNFPPWKGFGL